MAEVDRRELYREALGAERGPEYVSSVGLGGLIAPVAPVYDLPTQLVAQRPVREALPNFKICRVRVVRLPDSD